MVAEHSSGRKGLLRMADWHSEPPFQEEQAVEAIASLRDLNPSLNWDLTAS